MRILDQVILTQPTGVRVAFLEVLNWVLHADGVVDAREVRFLDEVATRLEVLEQREALPEAPEWTDSWTETLEPVATWILMQASLIAWADGELHDDEISTLETLSRNLGLKDNVFDQILIWSEKGYRWEAAGLTLLEMAGEWDPKQLTEET